MTKPLTINLQINIYPDGTVAVNPLPATEGLSSAGAVLVNSQSKICTESASALSKQPPCSSAAAGLTASGEAGPICPSESDVRAALLAAVKRSDKATAVGVLEKIAGVSRVPEVPAELRAEVIAALVAISPADDIAF